jgi:aryl-alcohol dehydrogenase-like predicted oxidoreductase
METRLLGNIGAVSCLTLGGGGLGQIWGATTRDEAIATVGEAAAAGITVFDVAPRYGDGEAETVIGEAFGGHLREGVRVVTKCLLGSPPAAEVYPRLRASLEESLGRMRLAKVDVYVLHGMIEDGDADGATMRTGLPLLFDTSVRAAQERGVDRRLGNHRRHDAGRDSQGAWIANAAAGRAVHREPAGLSRGHASRR